MESDVSGMRPQERATDYRAVAACRRGRFRSRHGIHNETLAAQQPPHLEPIYYCATGVEMPAFEPCKDKQDQRDI